VGDIFKPLQGLTEPGSGCCWSSTINAIKINSQSDCLGPQDKGRACSMGFVQTRDTTLLLSCRSIYLCKLCLLGGHLYFGDWANSDMRCPEPSRHRAKSSQNHKNVPYPRPLWESGQGGCYRGGWGLVCWVTSFLLQLFWSYFTGFWVSPFCFHPRWSGQTQMYTSAFSKTIPISAFREEGLYLLPAKWSPKEKGQWREWQHALTCKGDSGPPPGKSVQDSPATSSGGPRACWRL
jgi:hypothetical protein